MKRKYPSPADIEEMRARGYDKSVIDDAIERSARWHEKERLKERIRSAFASVRLGGGVGLFEAQAMDDYADDAIRAASRGKDEKLEWSALKTTALNECNSSLSFFDAAGMRFHLPAYLCADLDAEYEFELLFSLTHVGRFDDQFCLLDMDQRAAVRDYLEFRASELYGSDKEEVEAVLAGYWADAV